MALSVPVVPDARLNAPLLQRAVPLQSPVLSAYGPNSWKVTVPLLPTLAVGLTVALSFNVTLHVEDGVVAVDVETAPGTSTQSDGSEFGCEDGYEQVFSRFVALLKCKAVTLMSQNACVSALSY